MTDEIPTLFDNQPAPMKPWQGGPDQNQIGKAQAEGQAETSKESALLAYPRSGTQRARVMAKVLTQGDLGATDEQLQDWLQMNPSTQRPRRVELVDGRWIKDSGERRMTRSGRDAVVWVATDKARARS